MKAKTSETRGSHGLTINGIEDVVDNRIYDAEGVRVATGDFFAMLNENDLSAPRRFGRVIEVCRVRVRVRWIHWDEGPAVLASSTFENFCRIEVDERPTSTPPVTWTVGDGATALGWSDAHAGTIIEAGPRRVVWQQDEATLVNREELEVTPGGFAAHWEGSQRYTYKRDLFGSQITFTLRKNGRWIEKGAPLNSTSRLVAGRHKHHDYNF